MPAGRSEYDLTIAVHAFDDAYKELIRTINQDHRRTIPKEKKSVQESVPRMVTISLVNRGITSAKCLSIFEYYLYSAYLESMRKDIRTAYDHILISRFQNTLRLVDHVAHYGANYSIRQCLWSKSIVHKEAVPSSVSLSLSKTMQCNHKALAKLCRQIQISQIHCAHHLEAPQ